jgi:hypothetical protein
MAKERWRPVVGYEDCYKISDGGRLARIAGYGNAKTPCWKIRAPAFKTGYTCFHMCRNGVRKYRTAHVMVWEAFRGPIPKGKELNHKNGIRSDPSLRNLEILSRSENAQHSFVKLGRKSNFKPRQGRDNGSAKLTEADIPKIFEARQRGLFQYQIAELFGVSQPTIGNILRGKNWRHLRAARK